MTNGISDFGAFQPAGRGDGQDVWPPRVQYDRGLLNVLKRIQAFLTRSELVWLRDYDEFRTLAVVKKRANGVRVAARFWPGFRMMILNDDGTVTSDDQQANYVSHWIAVNETEKTFMLLQNSETYAEPDKER